ncbi:LPS translocon maturation chaperone LptM [Succinivibrio dextrinosolvens]|uniref:Lipoprotein-attachment site-containing protein n=1 Tax=Succinivibrio dextrinosolvens DSM 3072 TaxID=1123324 RepID=A0A1T4UVK9_9GAMM|nr:lipoprotein [Succinivibrio dextrinosolvens]MBE6423845.1 hypothetical protein [Succinivibrio dextrinosolvens]SKA56743.1 hypothetical protein SAMN02745213_00071 [Succinivibrio dextrinosolvens DSM 3072]
MNKIFVLLSLTVATLFLYGCGIKGPLYIEKDPVTNTQAQKADQQQPGTQGENGNSSESEAADSQPVLY